MKKLIFLSILIVANLNAFSAPYELKHPSIQGSIFINMPTGWDVHQNVLGMPFVLFSPKENGQKSNLSFVPTSAELKVDDKSLGKDIANYQQGKKNWANKIGATIDGFEPLKSFINKHGNKVTRVGVYYTFKKKKYLEKSFYIECDGRLLHSKALTLKSNVGHYKNIDSVIQGVRCVY